MLKDGDVFGWAALLEKFPRRLAECSALEAMETVRISGDELLRVLATDPMR
jgi:CRP-like cAMP-binding protein